MWIQIKEQYQWQRDYFDAPSFLLPTPRLTQNTWSEARTLFGKVLYICSSYSYVIYWNKSFYVIAYTEVWVDPNHSLQPRIYLEGET